MDGDTGAPLPALALEVELEAGSDGESGRARASVAPALLEAALRGELGGEDEAAAAPAPTPAAATPAELITLYATAGPACVRGRLKALNAALTGFQGGHVGVEVAGDGGMRVVGLWRRGRGIDGGR